MIREAKTGGLRSGTGRVGMELFPIKEQDMASDCD